MRKLVLCVLPLLLLGACSSESEPTRHSPTPEQTDAAETKRWEPRLADYPSTVTIKDIAIPMSDGATIYADLTQPSIDGSTPVSGQFPTILIITPYNKSVPLGAIAPGGTEEYLTTRGYNVLLVDTRGTGASDGLWEFGSAREQRDSYELVEWAAVQPWSDGNIGRHGGSALGVNQFWTAAQQPPHLRAIMPIVAPADLYRTTLSGGELSSVAMVQSLILGGAFAPPPYALEDLPQTAVHYLERAGVLVNATAATVSGASGGKMSYDNPFLRNAGGYWMVDRIQVPTFLVGGWTDVFRRDSPLMFEQLQARGIPVKLLMGPWVHTNVGEGLPADGLPNSMHELTLRWMDRHVAGRPDPSFDEWAPVTYYNIGEDRYQTASSWPPRQVEYASVYLSTAAAPTVPGELSLDPPEAAGADLLVAHPLSGLCSESSQQALIGLPPDTPCSEDEALNDLTGLAYDLPAVQEPRFLAGPVAARLFVSTNRADAFLNIRLSDVAPDGTVTQLSDGNDTVSLRALDSARTRWLGEHIIRPFHPYTKESQLSVEPDQVYELHVELASTAAVIASGHRLRVTVQPSDAAQSVIVGDRFVNSAGALITIHRGDATPSSVTVPFLRM